MWVTQITLRRRPWPRLSSRPTSLSSSFTAMWWSPSSKTAPSSSRRYSYSRKYFMSLFWEIAIRRIYAVNTPYIRRKYSLLFYLYLVKIFVCRCGLRWRGCRTPSWGCGWSTATRSTATRTSAPSGRATAFSPSQSSARACSRANNMTRLPLETFVSKNI